MGGGWYGGNGQKRDFPDFALLNARNLWPRLSRPRNSGQKARYFVRAAGLTLCVLLFSAWGAQAAPDDAAARLHIFETQLEANPSATAVLQSWCDAHAPAGTRIIARQVQPAPVPPPEEARKALAMHPGEAVRYRRVQLMCGGRVLSNADNWYLPGKLTGAMNSTLDHSQTPFGKAVAALHFSRRNLETVYLPPGGPNVLRHSAVLLTGKSEPFSFVVETYTKAILEN